MKLTFKKFCLLKYLFNNLRFYIDTSLQMSCNKEKQNHLEASNGLQKDIKTEKKDVVERFLSILWKKEVDFKFSTK